MQWRYNTENHLQQASTFSNRIHRTWQYRHDERGRIIEAIDPAGTSLRPGYPEDGMAQPASRSASMTDKPAGRVAHLTDDFGRRVASLSPDSGKTRYVYDDADRLIASTDAAGNRAAYAYDISGRILRPYLWPGDQPLAVIHNPPGRASAGDGALVQAKRDGGTALLHFATPYAHKAQSVSS